MPTKRAVRALKIAQAAIVDEPVAAPQTFINRELSSLEFNQRVLAQSLDPRGPLLERLKFLCISSSNLDEFFEIRVAGLKQLLELGSTQVGPDGLAIADQLAAIHQRATGLVRDQYACLNDVLLPALRDVGIEVADEADWNADTRTWVERHFLAEVEPVLSPLGLDPARPFPRIQNKSLNFIVRLSGKDAYGRDSELAIVQAPRSLPRIVALPDGGGRGRFVALSTIVEAFVPHLFGGVAALHSHQGRGPVNLNRFSAIYDLAPRSALKSPPFTPGLPARLVGATDLFAVIRQRDVLLHHAYP